MFSNYEKLNFIFVGIIDSCEEKGFPGDGLPRLSPVFRGDDPCYPFRPVFPPAYFEERADNGPYHVPQKTVGRDFENQIIAVGFRGESARRQMGRDIVFPACGKYIAYGRGIVGPRLFEGAEIHFALEQDRRFVHGRYVQTVGIKI